MYQSLSLSQRGMHKAKYLFSNWKHIFPSGPTNQVFTDLIEHELSLVDETPFKTHYREDTTCTIIRGS